MKSTREMLELTQSGIEIVEVAQRQASVVALMEMNKVGDTLTDSGLIIPQEPFLFSMFGESMKTRVLASNAQSRIDNIAHTFGPQSMHTAFANKFPPTQLHMFDESTENENLREPSIDDKAGYSAVRYEVRKEAAQYLGKVIVPTFAVINYKDLVNNREPEVKRSGYVAMVVVRPEDSIESKIELIDMPLFAAQLETRTVTRRTEDRIRHLAALHTAAQAIRAHPDYLHRF
jgi:cytidylate kinase